MTIYDTSGEVILDAPVTTDAVIRYVLMGDYYIGLPFNLLKPADFPRGSYVMYKGRKFEIMSNVRPEFDDTTGGYKYSLQFWAQQNHMKRRKCKWLQGQNPETTFHDTTDLASFGNLIADNMNAFLGGENWKVAAVPEEFAEVTKLVSFDRDSCWDAINTIAETFDVEWWTVENGAEVWIYFGKLEFGTPEVFKRGDVVTSIPAKKGDDANYGTRFFVFGSTRNLTADYGQAPQGGTTNHVSEVRLRLPNGQEYIDARENLKPADVVEQVAYFEDIYPKNTDTVTSVDRSQDRQTSNGTKYKARIIYAKDAPFVPTDLIEGETLQAVITSGPLSGRTFDIQLGSEFQDPDAWNPEQNPFDRKFEIVADIEDAGDGEELIIPNDSLDIDAGDTFVLTGVKLPDERIKEAEQELLKAGKAWAVKNSSDTDVYDCPTNPVYCQRHDKNYDPGQKVLLQDPRFGASGRQSRIQGFEKKLYNEYIATYTVGDNTSYSRLAAIEKDIEESAYAERIGVVNGVGIYLIRSKYDTTLPTDYNAYSALAAETLFLNKRKGGTVLGSTTFDKDITIGGSVVSKDFRQGDFSGSGFGAYRDKNGNAVLEADILKIRKEAVFNEAVINQVTFRVGATVFSNGGCEITRVEELETAFRCYYDNKEGRRYSGLTAGDQVRCQRYDPTQHAIIKYYWRLVTAVGEDYVELSKSDADGSASPEAGDEIAQFGNRSDITRQSAIVINPLDGGSVEVYAHIDAYSLSEKNYVGMGVNPQTGEAYMYAYGDMFFGDRDLADPKSSWITYQKKEGEERRRLRIKADVTFGADSSGLGNLSEFKAQQQQIDDARKEAEEAKKEVAGIQIGSVNLLDGSREFTVTAGSGDNHKFQVFDIGEVEAGEVFALSVENISVLAGTPGELSVRMYNEGASKDLANYVEISTEERTALFTIKSDVTKQKAKVLFYAGKYAATAGNSVRYEGAVLVRGNKPALSWSPSIADQEKYADEAVNGVETLIDASKLDQNTYYPVTIKLNGIARSKITVRVNLSDTQPGKPAWSTYKENRFSCQAVWYNNGNSWGSNYDKRVVEEYQHRYADGRPIGSVGQMTNSSNEYIYVRGGGVYRFLATNAGTPVLHTEAYTVDEQTVDIKTSVEPLVSLQEQANSTQQEAETTRQAIADMNDDTIFDVSEKQSIRTQWENISGYARTNEGLDGLPATDGSYYRVRDMAKAAGISTAGLSDAVKSLRVKLNDYALYTASNTPGFDRAGLAVLFTAYYAQEIDVLNAVSQKYTDGKVADIETTMQDYDYLKLVFPNNTVDNNGVFLSRLMAVKNGTSASAAVVAGLYGGGVDSLNNAGFKDPTHGILMMFAGATSIQNVAAAKTRIYGDGALFTDKLYATGGNIGNFTITDGYLSTYKNNVGMELANDRFLLGINSEEGALVIAASLKAQYRTQTISSYELFRPYCSIEYLAPHTRAAMPRNVALEIDAVGAAMNATKPNVADLKSPADYALLIHRGTTAGLRFYSRKVSSGQTNLSLFDMFIYADTSGGSAIFMLPDNPPPNQFYLIRKLKAANKVIVSSPSSSKDLIYPTGNDKATQKIEWTGRRAGILQYSEDLGAWVLEFTYEA